MYCLKFKLISTSDFLVFKCKFERVKLKLNKKNVFSFFDSDFFFRRLKDIETCPNNYDN